MPPGAHSGLRMVFGVVGFGRRHVRGIAWVLLRLTEQSKYVAPSKPNEATKSYMGKVSPPNQVQHMGFTELEIRSQSGNIHDFVIQAATTSAPR